MCLTKEILPIVLITNRMFAISQEKHYLCLLCEFITRPPSWSHTYSMSTIYNVELKIVGNKAEYCNSRRGGGAEEKSRWSMRPVIYR